MIRPQRTGQLLLRGDAGLPAGGGHGRARRSTPGCPGPGEKKDETIASQTAALRAHAGQLGVELPEEWVFEDEGHSGATLVRPALERLRDVVAGVGVDVVLCYSPDRLARKFAYQGFLIEEFARAGTRVEFIKGPRGDSPEDQLLVQFQGMFAEYEKAQILERYRRGKAHRARTGSVNVLSGAPYGYRYVRKNDHAGAGYEIVEHEATLVAELFRRYADDGASIADLTRWLTDQSCGDSHRQIPLGPLSALGHAAQPRLRR
ncbi:MAG: recombinase family protein [Pseudonocardiaceae bacterium]